ncbi:uncharacterized protein LOC135811201 [Sycon ciliatum]|uniref:uncharacterized protein LOC135811201 n=1 Tax=Sycon ciliatum TaxID=27933 RepID=UPI0031F6B0F0
MPVASVSKSTMPVASVSVAIATALKPFMDRLDHLEDAAQTASSAPGRELPEATFPGVSCPHVARSPAADTPTDHTMGLILAGVATSTTWSYAASVTASERYARLHRVAPYPIQATRLLDFLAYMSSKCRLATIKVYLHGLRHYCVVNHLTLSPFQDERLDLLLQGIARNQRTSSQVQERRAVTQHHLRAIQGFLPHSGLSPADQAMLWSAITLAYYGFLRVSEYASTDPRKMLTQERVCIRENTVTLAIPFSKTTQLGEGSDVTVGATNDSTCPVAAFSKYAQLRPQVAGAYFRYQSGQPLRPSDMNDLLRRALAGQTITSHSLGIGAATAA